MLVTKDNYFDYSDMAISIGFFDGLHAGHRALINSLGLHKKNTKTAIINLNTPKPIYTINEKTSILYESGLSNNIDYFVIVDSNEYELHRPHLLCKIEPVLLGHKRVCSKTIVTALNNGDLAAANAMLAMPFTLFGQVVHGQAKGRKVGMPTANLLVPEDKLLPKHGVYAVNVIINGTRLLGLTNIGLRPSVDNNTNVSIETHIINYDNDLYGQNIRIEVLQYIRNIIKFDGIDQVKAQVQRDVDFVLSNFKVNV